MKKGSTSDFNTNLFLAEGYCEGLNRAEYFFSTVRLKVIPNFVVNMRYFLL